MECRHVRASFTDRDITVYQAYPPQIADAAIAAGTFVAPFKRGRMTWIKPSFLWMMYRSGWATKPGQERVLAVQVTRDGFEWALAHAVLSHYEPGTHDSRQQWAERKQASPVRVQWDPDRSLSLAPLGRRAIQVGLSARPSAGTSTSGSPASPTSPRSPSGSTTTSGMATSAPRARNCPLNGCTRCRRPPAPGSAPARSYARGTASSAP